MKALFLFLTTLISFTLARPVAMHASKTPALSDAVNSTDISVRHKRGYGADFMLVTVTRKQGIVDQNGVRVAQAATNVIYHFDLAQTYKVAETLPDIPLKLYPVRQGRMSTYATFLPNRADGYFVHHRDARIGQVDDDDEQRREPLHWKGTQDGFEVRVHLEVDVCGYERKAKVRVVTLTDEGWKELESLHSDIPLPLMDDAGTGKGRGYEVTLQQLLLHYYRGSSNKAYGKLQELYEYAHTAVVGFLSPFMLLGIVLVIIVVGVFVCCDLFSCRQQQGIALANDDEDSTEKV